MFSLFPSRAVALELFGFSIHWYGVLYCLAFFIAWYLLPRLQQYRGLLRTDNEWSNLLTAGILGVIIGGRLGFVLFYEPEYYALHPLQIFAVWNGGMSSHGGFIGVTLALLWELRGEPKRTILAIGDIVTVPIAIGLALGRLGNFINQELYGTVTTLPWGMHFAGAEGIRHPLQLYDVGLSLIMAYVCYRSLKSSTATGKTLALLLILYGVVRFFLETIREQTYAASLGLTRGQLLTIPLILIGVWLWRSTKKEI